METKPFNLQSPEQIAKDYGGNKQKIAQAASMGMVDPTAAVLAGMFIDRMRSAQMLEQQPQGTVAQQVFQPQQAPQGAPPMGAPPMGAPPMGAPPQGAPPPMGAPPMGAPPPPQPPGMAMGGLMDLSVPDDMFSEPVTDAENFAGGGLVAFAMGGEADEDDESYDLNRVGVADTPAGRMLSDTAGFFASLPERERARRAREWQRGVSAAFGGEPPARLRVAPDAAPAAKPAAPAPRAAAAATPAAPRPAAPRPGTGVAPSPRVAMAPPSATRGLGAIAAPQGGPRAPVPGAPTAPGAPSAPQAPAGPTGMQGGIEEFMRLQKQYGGDAATPYRDRLAAAAEAQLDPKAMAAQKKQDMWQAVAQFGFNMAATNSPYFMQAAGQAGAATVPFMAASRKERKAAERDALKQLADIEGLTAAEKKQALQSGVAYAQNLVDDQRQESQFQQTLGLTREKFEFDKQQYAQDRALRARGSGGGGGGLGVPDFPGGEYGYRVKLFYDREMAKAREMLAKNPSIKADQAWWDRYSLDAQRRAVEAVDAQRDGGGKRRERSSSVDATPSSGWGEMTVK